MIPDRWYSLNLGSLKHYLENEIEPVVYMVNVDNVFEWLPFMLIVISQSSTSHLEEPS